jgi:hypothetical protein
VSTETPKFNAMEEVVAKIFCDTVEAMPNGTKMELCDDTLKAVAQVLRKAMPVWDAPPVVIR